jgi:hypothetical protein
MFNFRSFLNAMGNLHDTSIEMLAWDPKAGTVVLKLDDIYWNFEGFPEYPGPQPASITLRGVSSLIIDLRHGEPAHIDDFTVEIETPEKGIATIALWPSGKIVVAFTSVDMPSYPVPQSKEGLQ